MLGGRAQAPSAATRGWRAHSCRAHGFTRRTELEILPLDPGDWLDDSDRALLHDALRQSQDDVQAGRLVSAEDVLRELRGS